MKWRPEDYDKWYETPLGGLSDRLEKDLVFSGRPLKGRASDAGCGTGTMRWKRREGGSHGVDASRSQGALKGEKVPISGSARRTSRACLSLRSNSISFYPSALCFIRDRQSALLEIPALRPGGRIIVAVLSSLSPGRSQGELRGLSGIRLQGRKVHLPPLS